MAVSFIGGGSRNTRRKSRTCRKSLANFIIWYCIEYTSLWAGFKLTTLVVISTDCTDSCKSNYNAISTTTAPILVQTFFHRQIMVYFGKIISSLHDKELKDFWLRDKPIGFYLPFKLSGRSLTKLHIILVMKSWIANLSKVKKLWLFGRKTNKERTKNGKFTSF